MLCLKLQGLHKTPCQESRTIKEKKEEGGGLINGCKDWKSTGNDCICSKRLIGNVWNKDNRKARSALVFFYLYFVASALLFLQRTCHVSFYPHSFCNSKQFSLTKIKTRLKLIIFHHFAVIRKISKTHMPHILHRVNQQAAFSALMKRWLVLHAD